VASRVHARALSIVQFCVEAYAAPSCHLLRPLPCTCASCRWREGALSPRSLLIYRIPVDHCSPTSLSHHCHTLVFSQNSLPYLKSTVLPKGPGVQDITPSPGTHQTLHRHLEADPGCKLLPEPEDGVPHKEGGLLCAAIFFVPPSILGGGPLLFPPSGLVLIEAFRFNNGPTA